MGPLNSSLLHHVCLNRLSSGVQITLTWCFKWVLWTLEFAQTNVYLWVCVCVLQRAINSLRSYGAWRRHFYWYPRLSSWQFPPYKERVKSQKLELVGARGSESYLFIQNGVLLGTNANNSQQFMFSCGTLSVNCSTSRMRIQQYDDIHD